MATELLTADEAAELLRVSGTTMRRWARLGLIRSIRLPSGQIRIPRSEVERLLRDGPGVSAPASPARQRVQPAAGARQAIPKAVSAPGRTEQLQPLAAAIIARGDRVLMTRRRFREGSLVWGFPTGECEPGETPEQAATREVEEEVGLTVAVERRLGERIHPVTRRHMVYLACTVLAGEARLIDHEELAELAWCTLAEVIERAAPAGGLYPPVQEYLERALTRAQP